MSIFLAFAAGILIGLVFYGGLWLTVRALMSSRHPVFLTLSSFWARTILAVAGFLVVANGRWQNVLACLAGFVSGRVLVSLFLNRRRPRCT